MVGITYRFFVVVFYSKVSSFHFVFGSEVWNIGSEVWCLRSDANCWMLDRTRQNHVDPLQTSINNGF